MAVLSSPLASDLDEVLEATRDMWEDLRGERLFITGGTGFFGCWLLESFLWANERLGLHANACVLTRSEAAFRAKAPRLAGQPALSFTEGDVTTFPFPAGGYSHVIHAATEASAALNEADPLRMLDTIVAGTRRTLEFACEAGARKFLLTSSGAVYGPQPPELPAVHEDFSGGGNPATPRAAYGEGKRLAEFLTATYAKHHGLDAKIARCFAFVGPYLPLDGSFAAGNFVRDALDGGPIIIKGNPMAERSYLYAADLAVWLWTILFKGECARPYNVGSGRAVTIADLASVIAEAAGPGIAVRRVPQATPSAASDRYVPATGRARDELGLREGVPLKESIRRTLDWYQAQEARV